MNPNLLVDPTVVTAITRTLRRHGVRRSELQEQTVEVQTRALAYLRARPNLEAAGETAGSWAGLCVTIAKRMCRQARARNITQAKRTDGLCGDPDRRAPLEGPRGGREAVDAKRMVAVLRTLFDAGELPARADEVLDCMQAGMNGTRTASALGLPVAVVYAVRRQLRARLEGRLVAMGMPMDMLAAPPPRRRKPRATVAESPEARVECREHDPGSPGPQAGSRPTSATSSARHFDTSEA